VHTTTYDTWTEQGDPHTRLIIDIVEIDRVPHGCRVVATWGEKSEIIKRLSASVVLAEATTRLEYGAEVIRWMARARGIPVEIELRVPTYVNEPGRTQGGMVWRCRPRFVVRPAPPGRIARQGHHPRRCSQACEGQERVDAAYA